MNALFLLADGCEETEAITIIDLLRRANVHVTTCSVTDNRLIHGAHGIDFQADSTLASEGSPNSLAARFNLIACPGGMGCMQTLAANSLVLETFRAFDKANRLCGAICASPAVLDTAGLLEGKRYVCYPGIHRQIKSGIYVPDTPALRDGNLITGSGPATAMTFALLLIEALAGQSVRDHVAEALLAPVSK
ncbi:MAG: DJ-1 family glyoxalase III [Kiritimatiellia bacterium]